MQFYNKSAFQEVQMGLNLLCKHPVNQVLVALGDGFAADFQAGSHFAVVDGPLVVE